MLGTSSDRIGTPRGRAYYATLSKDLEAATGLPIAPYAGACYGTFDDELVGIAGLRVRWSERFSSTAMWDGHELHHVLETWIGERHTLGVVVAQVEGESDVGLTYSVSF
jgi:hypothetical protein